MFLHVTGSGLRGPASRCHSHALHTLIAVVVGHVGTALFFSPSIYLSLSLSHCFFFSFFFLSLFLFPGSRNALCLVRRLNKAVTSLVKSVCIEFTCVWSSLAPRRPWRKTSCRACHCKQTQRVVVFTVC